jgi:RNA-binding protein
MHQNRPSLADASVILAGARPEEALPPRPSGMAPDESRAFEPPAASDDRADLPAKPLTGKRRRQLRALGHALKPVVQVGRAGLTDRVLAEIGTALEAHELIKVKLGKETPLGAPGAAVEIERATRSAVVQVTGRVLVLYRRRDRDPKLCPSPTRQQGGPRGTRSASRTGPKGTRGNGPSAQRAGHPSQKRAKAQNRHAPKASGPSSPLGEARHPSGPRAFSGRGPKPRSPKPRSPKPRSPKPRSPKPRSPKPRSDAW